jgi:hypothetical protein
VLLDENMVAMQAMGASQGCGRSKALSRVVVKSPGWWGRS